MNRRPGCLTGLLEMAFLSFIFDWLQDNFGFGKGVSCTGCGCGLILLILFLAIACSILFSTNWLHLTMDMGLAFI